MNRSDLINALKDKMALSRKDAEKVVDMFFDALKVTLSEGERVEIRGFGSFTVNGYKSYIGRNPKTGEEIPISARRVVTFRPGQKLKARVEAYAGTGE